MGQGHARIPAHGCCGDCGIERVHAARFSSAAPSAPPGPSAIHRLFRLAGRHQRVSAQTPRTTPEGVSSEQTATCDLNFLTCGRPLRELAQNGRDTGRCPNPSFLRLLPPPLGFCLIVRKTGALVGFPVNPAALPRKGQAVNFAKIDVFNDPFLTLRVLDHHIKPAGLGTVS